MKTIKSNEDVNDFGKKPTYCYTCKEKTMLEELKSAIKGEKK